MTDTPKIYLESERIFLRQCTESDFAFLKDLDSDPAVMTYLTNGVPSSDEQVREGMGRTFKYYKMFDGRFGIWNAHLKDSKEFIGWFLLRPDRENLTNEKDLEIGYRLKRKFWGKGYATEMSFALMDKAFQDFAAATVWAKTMKKNTASSNIMKKLGMTFEKEFEETLFYGEERTAVQYRITREEWGNQRPGRTFGCSDGSMAP